MSAKTTAQASNGPSRPDERFRSKSASGMNRAARAPLRLGCVSPVVTDIGSPRTIK